MTHKTVFLWGSLSSFSAPLVANLLQRDWHVHIATKSSLNLVTLVPLDLKSRIQACLDKALGGHEITKIFNERLHFIESPEIPRGTKYDGIVFCPLPPNFDESRAPRAPWAAAELNKIVRHIHDIPTLVVSSLWGAIQSDGVVPEELEFQRRKPQTHWENLCQQYEFKLLRSLSHFQSPWNLIRLPLLTGSIQDGKAQNLSGLYGFLEELSKVPSSPNKSLRLEFSPNSTFWFLPVDYVVQLFTRFLDDASRPQICNMVSTQSILNSEWLHYVADALGYKNIEPVTSDNFNLPTLIRKMLNDNVLVKTRNLFEVAGRYSQPPIKLSSAYFEKLIQFGQSEHWGRFLNLDQHSIPFSKELADSYFTKFLPHHLDSQELKTATNGGASIGFYIDEPEQIAWILKISQEAISGNLLSLNDTSPQTKLHFSRDAMMQLIQNKMSLHQLLLLRRVRIEGNVIDIIRTSSMLVRFFKQHPYIIEAQ